MMVRLAARGAHIHVVAGYGSGFAWIITAYEPDENEWIGGFSARKEKA
jgi:hypothetical protein